MILFPTSQFFLIQSLYWNFFLKSFSILILYFLSFKDSLVFHNFQSLLEDRICHLMKGLRTILDRFHSWLLRPLQNHISSIGLLLESTFAACRSCKELLTPLVPFSDYRCTNPWPLWSFV